MLYGFRERERVQALFEAVTGARMMHNYIRIGGVNEDLPDDFGTANELAPRSTGARNRRVRRAYSARMRCSWLARRAIGADLRQKKRSILGVTGPALRACGVPEDVRISEPYSIYDRFDFGIPVGTYGDCWDRYYVRDRGDAPVAEPSSGRRWSNFPAVR